MANVTIEKTIFDTLTSPSTPPKNNYFNTSMSINTLIINSYLKHF